MAISGIERRASREGTRKHLFCLLRLRRCRGIGWASSSAPELFRVVLGSEKSGRLLARPRSVGHPRAMASVTLPPSRRSLRQDDVAYPWGLVREKANGKTRVSKSETRGTRHEFLDAALLFRAAGRVFRSVSRLESGATEVPASLTPLDSHSLQTPTRKPFGITYFRKIRGGGVSARSCKKKLGRDFALELAEPKTAGWKPALRNGAAWRSIVDEVVGETASP